MLISHNKKFIYTKTVKTAGTSVESYFERYCMPEGVWEFSHARDEYVSDTGVIGYRGMAPEGKTWINHMSAESIKDLIGESTWNSYFKFCVVRNPYDKLISAFHFLHQSDKGLSPNEEKEKLIEDFRSWIGSGAGVQIIDRDKYLIDNEICVDCFVRYESLVDDLEHVCHRLNIAFLPDLLPSLKKSARNPNFKMRDYYDDQCMNVVKELFEFELDYFGYKI